MEPDQVKAIASGLTTTVLGVSVHAQELEYWASILADLGVAAAALVTVLLGVQSYLKNKDK